MLVFLIVVGGLGFVDSTGSQLAIGILFVFLTLVNMTTIGPVCYPIVAESPSGRLRYKTITIGRFVYNCTGIFSNVLTPRMVNETGESASRCSLPSFHSCCILFALTQSIFRPAIVCRLVTLPPYLSCQLIFLSSFPMSFLSNLSNIPSSLPSLNSHSANLIPQTTTHLIQAYGKWLMQAWNWGAKTAFFYAGTNFLCLVWCWFRLPETKDRSFGELDILFARNVPARKFRHTKVDREFLFSCDWGFSR